MLLFKYFVSSVIPIVGVTYVASIILKQKIKICIKNILIFLISMTLSHLFNIFFVDIRILGNFLLYTVIFKLIFDMDILKSLMTSLFTCFLGLIAEIFLLVILLVTRININVFEEIDFYIISDTIIVLGMLLLINIKKLRHIIADYIENVNHNKNYYILLVSSFSVIAFLLAKNYQGLKIDVNSIGNLLVMISYSAVIIYLIKIYISQNRLKKDYDNLIEYTKGYEDLLEEIRIEQHENKNQLLTIKGMTTNENSKLKNYVDSLLEDIKTHKYQWISELKNIPNGGLKGLIYFKLNEMKSLNIKVEVIIHRLLENYQFDDIDANEYKVLSRILGIYLDNAREATLETDDKFIEFEITKDKNTIIFIISNTYNEHSNVEYLTNNGYTTKGKGRGHGLKLAQEMINKNHNFTQDKVINNGLYMQYLFYTTKK